jgi:hypothetical protein
MPNQYWGAITYGGGKFVAVSYSYDTTVYSTNGINWTQTPTPPSGSLWSITYGNGVFVAVGDPIPGAPTPSAVSTDGITWSSGTMPNDSFWRGASFGNGVFIAIDSSYASKSASSTNGITWTLRTLPTTSGQWRLSAFGG